VGSGLELKYVEKGDFVVSSADFVRLRDGLAAVVSDPAVLARLNLPKTPEAVGLFDDDANRPCSTATPTKAKRRRACCRTRRRTRPTLSPSRSAAGEALCPRHTRLRESRAGTAGVDPWALRA
jgi:hypothetical protein